MTCQCSWWAECVTCVERDNEMLLCICRTSLSCLQWSFSRDWTSPVLSGTLTVIALPASHRTPYFCDTHTHTHTRSRRNGFHECSRGPAGIVSACDKWLPGLVYSNHPHICLLFCLPACPSSRPCIHTTVCPSSHPPVYLSIYLSIYPSICAYLCMHLSVYIRIYLYVYIFVSIHPYLSTYLPICLALSSIHLSVYLSGWLSIHTYLFI